MIPHRIAGTISGMDGVDEIIIANSPDRALHLLVLDAPALLDAARERADRVSLYCDDIRDARLLPPELVLTSLDAATLAGVDLVWLRLPTALGALEEYAELIAAQASPTVRLVAAGREKHLNRTMNEVLAKSFSEVNASLGARKARALLASGPTAVAPSWPRARTLPAASLASDADLELWSHGATFAAGRLDAGTKLLVHHLDQVTEADRYLDFGCGSGILATLLARANPGAEVFAVDASQAAVRATRATAAGTQVRTSWASELAGFADASLDVIVCNPPFHRGTAKDSGPAFGIFAEAARTLGDGGEFWCVFNSHLPWRNHLQRVIGPTSLVAQDRNYTLTRSLRVRVVR